MVRHCRASDQERQREGYATPQQCKENVLGAIDDEIDRLRAYQRKQAAIVSERTKLEVLRRNVPESASLDRLLRYEASLERAFDRTLNQARTHPTTTERATFKSSN